MHGRQRVERVVALFYAGCNLSQIADEVGVSRSTIRTWLKDPERWLATLESGSCPNCAMRSRAISVGSQYLYLLGMYLGDGYINREPRAERLRVALDRRYRSVIGDVARAMETVSGRRSSIVAYSGHVNVQGYSKHWSCVFPQVGPGRKHTRAIVLEPWQTDLVDADPRPLIRGLIHSDGCRLLNRVAGRKYEYVRYFFSNKSADIHAILRDALDRLDIRWTASRADVTSIARRDAVAALDAFVGPKS
jgi:AcrR family transcriptional regulator